jgi:hypothetical protein
MSAFGPKRTSAAALHMSVFGCKADMTSLDCKVLPRLRARLQGWDRASSSLFDGVMDAAAVTHDIVMSAYELLEWRIDIVEINIGDEAIDAGVNASGFLAVQITARGN